jgi:hypothetical protein
VSARKSLAEREADSAARAMREAIAPGLGLPSAIAEPLLPTSSFIPISAGPGFTHTGSEPAANLEPSTEPPTSTSTTTSSSSGERTANSKRHWRKPTDARRFASQMRAVATMVLNGEIDIETAKTYGALARAAVQAMSVQVTQARFARAVPDLTFDDDLFDIDAGDGDVDPRQTPPSEDGG